MREERRPRAPGPVRWIVRTLEEAGFETWAVGGAVRDALAGRPSGDWDLATRARPQQVRRIFRRTVPIGVEHGTVGVLPRTGPMVEVTTFRRDVETFGRRAVVAFADRIEEDLARRDFTINAVAWHPLREEALDPFGGLEDLRSRRLRTVGDPGERFAEDHLRVLRALRFAGRFELTIDGATWRGLVRDAEHLPGLSPERIREELVKVLGGDPRPSGALALYAASGALDVLYPELAAALDRPRSDGGRGDPWTHGVLTADVLPPSRPELRLSAVLGSALGAPGSDDGGRGAVAALLLRLRFSNAEVERVSERVAAGTTRPPGLSDGGARRRWLSRVGPERLAALGRLWAASARVDEARGRTGEADRTVRILRSLRRELRADPPLRVEDLALGGRDLIRMGLRPGPGFGRFLATLLDEVLEDPSRNDPAVLESRVLQLVGRNGDEVGVTTPHGNEGGAHGPGRRAGRGPGAETGEVGSDAAGGTEGTASGDDGEGDAPGRGGKEGGEADRPRRPGGGAGGRRPPQEDDHE